MPSRNRWQVIIGRERSAWCARPRLRDVARLPDDLIRFWRALDDRLSEVSATRWGALVTDPRFPAIWDANYARIDRPVEHLDLREVRDLLVPALQRAGAETFHVVSFFAEESRGILTELSSLGHTSRGMS